MNVAPAPQLMAGPLIRAERCEKCRFHTVLPQGPNYECRRNPPTVAVFPMQTKAGGQVNFQNYTTFPIVQPQQWCGEFRPFVGEMN